MALDRAMRQFPIARIILAAGWGYILANLVAIVLAQALPVPATEAVPGAALLALCLYPPIIVVGFALRRATHVLVGLIITILLGCVVVMDLCS